MSGSQMSQYSPALLLVFPISSHARLSSDKRNTISPGERQY